MTPSVTLHMINDELRISDIELGAKLGYGRPAKIRDLIKRNADELSRYGRLSALEKAPEVAGGRPVEEFYLNEGQAIRVATLANTIDTAEVCGMVVKAYAENRNSLTLSKAPTPDLASILSILKQMADTLAHLTKHMVSR
ncbi:UNVERIFIED_ORG: hypothetical protein GGD48_004137 [Rhizobium etli]